VSRRSPHPEIETAITRGSIGTIVAIYEPTYDAVSQVVGRSIADPRRGSVGDRSFERHDHHLRRPPFFLRVPNVVQDRVSKVVVVSRRFRERKREELAKIFLSTRG